MSKLLQNTFPQQSSQLWGHLGDDLRKQQSILVFPSKSHHLIFSQIQDYIISYL